MFNRASLVVFVVAVAVAIAPLVSVEVLGGPMPPVTRSVAMMRIFPVVAVIRPVAVVDIAVEVFRAMKPWAGTDKDAVQIEGAADLGPAQPELAANVGLPVRITGIEVHVSLNFRIGKHERPLDPGPVQLAVKIPSHLLNEGAYRVELAATLFERLWLIEPGNGAFVSFSIRGRRSASPYWSARKGVLAPVLEWEKRRDGAIIPQ